MPTKVTTSSTRLARKKKVTSSTLIVNPNGTERGTVTTAERDALVALQSGDWVWNSDTGFQEFYSDVGWIQGIRMYHPSGKLRKQPMIFPYPDGNRLELGDSDTGFIARFWDGTNDKFSIDTSGALILGDTLTLQGTSAKIRTAASGQRIEVVSATDLSFVSVLFYGSSSTVAGSIGLGADQSILRIASPTGPGFTASPYMDFDSSDSGATREIWVNTGVFSLSAIGGPFITFYNQRSANPDWYNVSIYAKGNKLLWQDPSNNVYDLSQVGAAGVSPLTTKGDLWTYSTVDTRIGVGADNSFLIADSSQAKGLRWFDLFGTSNTWTIKQTITLASDAVGLHIDMAGAATFAAIEVFDPNGIEYFKLGASGAGVRGTEYAGPFTFAGRRAAGTSDAPTAIAANSAITQLDARAYNGSAFVTSGKAVIQLIAAELWSTTAQGTYITFKTTKQTTTTVSEVMRLTDDGAAWLATQSSAPANPSSGYMALYVGTDLLFHALDTSGNNMPFGKYKSGAGVTNLADGDFAVTPPDGTTGTAHNTTTGLSYYCVRANGTWKSVEVA